MIDLIAIVVILLIVFCAGSYIYKAKKRGEVCIGCPAKGQCNRKKCLNPERKEL